VHDDPEHAKSDGPNALRLDRVGELLRQVVAIDAIARGR
jgi:3-deoxy-D-manno-octulosonic acid (KDO) 8-phosphate synthase